MAGRPVDRHADASHHADAFVTVMARSTFPLGRDEPSRPRSDRAIGRAGLSAVASAKAGGASLP